MCLSHYADTQGYSVGLLGVGVFSVCGVFAICSQLSCTNVGMADGAIKSQGVLSTELSVSMIGWLFVIDGARPTGQPPKSIQTAGKDEMAVGMWAAGKLSHTHTQRAPPLLV